MMTMSFPDSQTKDERPSDERNAAGVPLDGTRPLSRNHLSVLLKGAIRNPERFPRGLNSTG